MLKNDYLLAKIGLDTAENEPVKVQITDFSDHMFRSQTVRIVQGVPTFRDAVSTLYSSVGNCRRPTLILFGPQNVRATLKNVPTLISSATRRRVVDA